MVGYVSPPGDARHSSTATAAVDWSPSFCPITSVLAQIDAVRSPATAYVFAHSAGNVLALGAGQSGTTPFAPAARVEAL